MRPRRLALDSGRRRISGLKLEPPPFSAPFLTRYYIVVRLWPPRVVGGLRRTQRERPNTYSFALFSSAVVFACACAKRARSVCTCRGRCRKRGEQLFSAVPPTAARPRPRPRRRTHVTHHFNLTSGSRFKCHASSVFANHVVSHGRMRLTALNCNKGLTSASRTPFSDVPSCLRLRHCSISSQAQAPDAAQKRSRDKYTAAHEVTRPAPARAVLLHLRALPGGSAAAGSRSSPSGRTVTQVEKLTFSRSTILMDGACIQKSVDTEVVDQ
ncbi:hypothetical protein EVAR_21366_1 [Eumeta japonica]|uniref:Uncharacterized protein n=1 Tax=Eumeta variegata TaxID=151549 RepID=A0A4C1YED7_EUMVA|nr:hypothetical protein EVAR_21366_1 [Eumeta japonica]